MLKLARLVASNLFFLQSFADTWKFVFIIIWNTNYTWKSDYNVYMFCRLLLCLLYNGFRSETAMQLYEWALSNIVVSAISDKQKYTIFYANSHKTGYINNLSRERTWQMRTNWAMSWAFLPRGPEGPCSPRSPLSPGSPLGPGEERFWVYTSWRLWMKIFNYKVSTSVKLRTQVLHWHRFIISGIY